MNMDTAAYRDSAYYDKIAKQGTNAIEKEQLAYLPIWEWQLDQIPYDAKILDVGCGTGQFAQLCIEKACNKYLGLDFSEKVLQEADRRAPEMEFLQWDIEADPSIIPTESPDVVIFNEFFEHIIAETQVLTAVPRGTVVMITVPNFPCEGHVRWFRDMSDVKDRYSKRINITNEKTYGKWFSIVGTKKDFEATGVERPLNAR